MGPRQIGDVNVVPEARPIGRWVIRAMDLHFRPAAKRRIQRERNQMSFRIVIFTEVAIRIRAGCIEVPQRQIPEAMCLMKPV